MAIIYSYPLNDDIKPLDELVGTTEKSINGQLKTVTRNFLLQDLAEFFIVDGGLQKTITLTTSGTSGAATLNQLTGVLNIPQYSGGGSSITPSPLTGVNDTNVTLTLGGTPDTSLLQSVSLTLGWTGTLADSRIASASTWNAKQAALNGTGFVKSTAGVISYDTNSYYLASNPNDFIPLTALSSSATGLTYNNTTGVFSLTVGYSIPTTVSQTNWDNAYTYRLAGITTNGTSGAATLINNILNIPQYSGGGGSQNLQQVLDEGNISNINKGIYVYVNYGDEGALNGFNSGVDGTGVSGISDNATSGVGVYGQSEAGIGVYAFGGTGINGKSIVTYGNGSVGIEVNLGNTNKGLVINSGASSTGDFIQLDKNGVDKLIVNQDGELTAQKLIKEGGTSSQILAADGSVITAGNNITITDGQISSVSGSGGGGSTVNYYLNGGTSQGTFGGTTYYEFSRTAILGTGADFTRNTNGYIASFITDVADPSLLLIPAGNWNLEFFFNSSSSGGSPSFYTELYKYDGTTFTLIASDSATPEGITNGTTIDAYFTALAVPETVLTVNDRLAIRVYVNTSGRTITLHTQNGHLCEVITTFTNGLTALNGLQAQVQNFAVGTSGTDFAIDSSASTHTFNLPSASLTARGVVTTGDQSFNGVKTFNNQIKAALGILGDPDIQESYYAWTTNGSFYDLSAKQDAVFPAYSFYANNTNGATYAGALPFRNLTNQTYSGTIVWTGTTAPSSTTQHTYSLSQINNLVTLTINLSYLVAGAGITAVACELPSTAPTPALPASVSAVGDVLNYCNGMLAVAKTIPTTNAAFCALRIKSTSPNVYEIVINRTSAAYRYAYITIQYFV
jgi:hypothetical protein